MQSVYHVQRLFHAPCPKHEFHASVQVFKTGVDEWLKLCQYFALLAHQYCPDVQSPAGNKKKSKGKCPGKGKSDKAKQDQPAVEQILGLRLGDSAKRGTKGVSLVLLCRPKTCLTLKPDMARRK